MKNVVRKIKNISLLVGMYYVLNNSPFKAYVKSKMINSTKLESLLPNVVKAEINETAVALQLSANNPVEDRYILKEITLNEKKGYFLGVFDGHGGDALSEYANNNLIKYFLEYYSFTPECENENERIIPSIQRAFAKVEEEFRKISYERYIKGEGRLSNVGSCALIGIVFNNKLYLANLGDSKARMFSISDEPKHPYYVTKVSTVFNVRKDFEQKRLLKEFPDEENIYYCKAPGVCYVKGRLQPTRSLGDYYLKFEEFNRHTQTKENRDHYKKELLNFRGPYISSIPEIKVFELTKKDKYLLLASDGLWDFLKSREVSKILYREKNQSLRHVSYSLLTDCLTKAAKDSRMDLEKLLSVPEGSKRRRIHDDITLILLSLNKIKV